MDKSDSEGGAGGVLAPPYLQILISNQAGHQMKLLQIM